MRENNQDDHAAFLRQMSQPQQEVPSLMDDMMEQILSMASWNEAAAQQHHHHNSSSSSSSAKLPVWDYSTIAGGIAGLESMVALLNTNVNSNQVLDPDDNIGAFASQEGTSSIWQQPQEQGRGFLEFNNKAADALMLGKRIRDQDQQHQAASLMENMSAISGQQQPADGIFSAYGSAQVGLQTQGNAGRTSNGAQGIKTGNSETSNQEGVSHQAGTRPRVRARRGQATDPHSIAERLRRERIAERMKSLQELVPNSNKTDKASMLDEIIDYVKFLQLQVKVLSMSRLGNAGAVSSFMADLPAEESSKFLATLNQNGGAAALQEGLSLTERQVAKLMEEDMGSAMQYLQSKGLCLMPIHLASNMSNKSTNTEQQQQQHVNISTTSAAHASKGTRAKNQHDSATNSMKSASVKNGDGNTSSSQH